MLDTMAQLHKLFPPAFSRRLRWLTLLLITILTHTRKDLQVRSSLMWLSRLRLIDKAEEKHTEPDG